MNMERRFYPREIAKERQQFLMSKWLAEVEAVLKNEQTADDLARKMAGIEGSLEEEAIRDRLTGAFNYAAIGLILSQAMKFEAEYGHNLGVILCDLDHLKEVNDTQGHSAGDRALIKLVEILEGVVGEETSIIGRWKEGDEWMVILPHVDEKDLIAKASLIAETVSTELSDRAGLGPLQLTTSVGIYLARPEDNYTGAVEGVDRALYEAKRRGRNRVVLLEKLVKDPTEMKFKEVYFGQSEH